MEMPRSPEAAFDPARSVADLDRAAALGRDARRATRWYVRYLVAFAVATVALATLFGVLTGRTAALVSTPLWVVFIVALSVWAARQRATIRGFARLHVTTVVTWAVLWALVVTVGSRSFAGAWWWWLAGGLLVAVPPLVAAVHVHRRTRP